ncbi:MAG: bifunctional phosphoglucose/phosphomannose isomerase [Anaerolineales bacterium]
MYLSAYLTLEQTMNLDDPNYFRPIDSQNFIDDIDALPSQVETAWALGQRLALPESYKAINQIVISGMGGSAIGGALAQAQAAPECPVPISISRDYGLPAFAGANTLVICSSHSGNTEETLSAFEIARARGCKLLAITTGGKLNALAEEGGIPVWRFEHAGQPRAAVGFSFMLALAGLLKLGLIADKSSDVAEAVAAMRTQQTHLRAETSVVQNPSKRMAGQLMNRIPAIFASDYLAPVARRWKGQISEIAKAWSQFEELPELDHNSVVGTMYPEPLVSKFMVLFLRSAHDHPRNRLRSEVTREIYMTAGFNTDTIEASGASPLAQMLTLIHSGDYTAYYLAMCYGVDPSPVPQIDYLKEQLSRK